MGVGGIAVYRAGITGIGAGPVTWMTRMVPSESGADVLDIPTTIGTDPDSLVRVWQCSFPDKDRP
jgi:hypothetical protein